MRHAPQLSVKTWGGGFQPGGGGGVWTGVRGASSQGGGVRVRVTELVEPVLVL